MPERLRLNFVGGTILDDPLDSMADEFSSLALQYIPEIVLGEQYMAAVLDPNGLNGDPEIVWIIEHEEASSTAKIERGKEDSSYRSHPIGTHWTHTHTAQDWSSLTINTDGDPGGKIFVGEAEPPSWYAKEKGDIWIRYEVDE